MRKSSSSILTGVSLIGISGVVTFHAEAATIDDARAHLQHIIIIMQENCSFDTYFGAFPGADGLPSGTCVPLKPGYPNRGCVQPFHDPKEVNAGGP